MVKGFLDGYVSTTYWESKSLAGSRIKIAPPLAGESFGGHFVPAVAKLILMNSLESKERGMRTLSLGECSGILKVHRS